MMSMLSMKRRRPGKKNEKSLAAGVLASAGALATGLLEAKKKKKDEINGEI